MPLLQAQLQPTALFLETSPAPAPPLFKLPVPECTHRGMGEKNYWKEKETGSGFHLCHQISFFNELLRHKLYTRATNWNATTAYAQSDLHVRKMKAQSWWYTGITAVLGKTQGLVGILGRRSPWDPSAHFQAIAALFKSTVTKSTNFSR